MGYKKHGKWFKKKTGGAKMMPMDEPFRMPESKNPVTAPIHNQLFDITRLFAHFQVGPIGTSGLRRHERVCGCSPAMPLDRSD